MIVAQGHLHLESVKGIINRRDLPEGEGVTVNTHDQLFDNQNGTLHSLAQLTFDGGKTDNRAGTIDAKNRLALNAARLNNRQNGLILGQDETRLITEQTDNSDGQIESLGSLRIDSAVGPLDNSGTGRLYGDAISVSTLTFNNRTQDGVAATIAGRQRVNIGTDMLNNDNHALIYSDGDMAIGGALDSLYLATGRARRIRNR